MPDADWVTRYPRRSPHPPRQRVRFDAVGRATARGSNLLLALSAPLSLRDNSSPSAEMAPGTEATHQRQGRRGPAAPSGGRAVRFDSVVKLILVPARRDLDGLSEDLWWQEEDYLQFRCDTTLGLCVFLCCACMYVCAVCK